MFKKWFIGGVLTCMVCGCAHVPLYEGATDSTKKLQTRNNAASLLSDLLKDEQNVGKIFVLKSASPEVTDLVKLIGATAATHERELELLATNDAALKLNALRLPPGEMAARKGTTKSKEHDLLLSTGSTFEFNLLFSQAQAENYGWHLAVVAAENSTRPEEEREFDTIGHTMEHLYEQVIEQMRIVPAK